MRPLPPLRRAEVRLASVVGAVALVTAGCGLFGGDDEPTPAPDTTTTTIPVPSTELLDPGAEPRQALRFRFEAAESTVDVVVDLDVVQDQGGDPVIVDLPPVRQRVRIRTGALVGGEADVEMEIESLEVDPAAALSDSDREEIDGELAELVGLTGQGKVDDRGRVRSFTYDAPTGADGAIDGLVTGFSDELAGMVAPVPEEPVGVGARWRSTTFADVGGAAVPVTTVYELTAIDGDDVTFTSTSEGTASDRPLDPEVFGEGRTARLVEARTTGRGSGRFSLTSLDATLQAATETTQTMEVTGADGSTTTVDQQTTSNVLIGTLAEPDDDAGG
ncbi:MAG: hypothetical protein KF906_05650 [Actinobacteria bacterium]|nr:hypothetical protein [Actinomycetota bacterium]